MPNSPQSTPLPLSHTTKVRVQIDSHNFGKLEINDTDAKGAVLAFETEKSTRETGSLILTLAPFREWLDLLAADDLVNLYVHLGQSFKETNAYNVGWVRLFFGYINDVRRIESVNSDGVFTVRYQIACSDFQKAIERTEIYNNPFLDARETFGSNFVGAYLFRLGVSNQGNPRFLVMNHLAALFGFGKQWILPPHYEDRLSSEISFSGNSSTTHEHLKAFLARQRIGNDALKKVQELRNLALRFTLLVAETLEDTTINEVADAVDSAEDAATKESTVSDVVEPAAFAERLAILRDAKGLPTPARVQQTIDTRVDHSVPQSLFDVLCFDYMEYTDGWMHSISIWEYQGPLIELVRRVSHDVLNELIFDLRPTIDFHQGAHDGLGQKMDGALSMVPAVVLREYPYTTFPRGSRSFEDRVLNFSAIRVSGDTNSLVPMAQDTELVGKVTTRENVQAVFRRAVQSMRDSGFVVPTIVDWGGAVWSQKERVVDYGHSLGIDAEAPFTGESSSPDRIMMFQRGPRILESIQITSADVVSASLGRGDQDVITGFEFIPQTELAERQKYWNRDLAPLFRLLLIRRHGLRMFTRTSEFSGFAAVDLMGTYSQETIDTERLGPISPRLVGPSLAAYMTLRIVTLCDHWYQHNIEYLNGTIVLRPMPGLRVGYRLDWVDRGLSFYVEAVSHSWQFPNLMTTQVQVTRGQPLNNPLEYQLPDDRVKKEFASSFKLGINFPVADPEGYEAENSRRRTNAVPGMPGRYSPRIIFDNLKTMVVPYPDGVNKANRSRGQALTSIDLRNVERPVPQGKRDK